MLAGHAGRAVVDGHVDRLGRDPHLVVVGVLDLELGGDLLGRPLRLKLGEDEFTERGASVELQFLGPFRSLEGRLDRCGCSILAPAAVASDFSRDGAVVSPDSLRYCDERVAC